ncbi:MAG: hypothetical protein R2839_03660 [Thermomicrobiales bacterium]
MLGILGAIVGGFLWESVQDDKVEFGWDIGSFAIAILGGIVIPEDTQPDPQSRSVVGIAVGSPTDQA